MGSIFLISAVLPPRSVTSLGSGAALGFFRRHFHLDFDLGYLFEILVSVVDLLVLRRHFRIEFLRGEVVGVPEVPAAEEKRDDGDNQCIDA